MKKCRITVEKAFMKGKKELTSSRSVVFDESEIHNLCVRLSKSVSVLDDDELAVLFYLIKSL